MFSAVGVVSLLALGAGAKAQKAPALIRPPKVFEEKDFLARCIKCGRCISVCPKNVISAAECHYRPQSRAAPKDRRSAGKERI